jgi:hypothetical protein
MATLKEQVTKAIKDKDAKTIGAFVEHCRFNLGMRYDDVLRTAQRWVPELDAGDWDCLLAEADDA